MPSLPERQELLEDTKVAPQLVMDEPEERRVKEKVCALVEKVADVQTVVVKPPLA